ncbi:MAG: hypothetical protein AAB973_00465 [Patescibacteria group bacterium]
MNNSTVKSVVVVGLLFLAGLVVLSFVNFLAFSPSTPGVVSTITAATAEYQDVGASLVSLMVQRIKCVEGTITECKYRKPAITISVENNSDVEIVFSSEFHDQYGGQNSVWCGKNTNLIFGVSVQSGEEVTISCEEIPMFWVPELKKYAPPNRDPNTTSPTTACIKIRNSRKSDTSATVCKDITDIAP